MEQQQQYSLYRVHGMNQIYLPLILPSLSSKDVQRVVQLTDYQISKRNQVTEYRTRAMAHREPKKGMTPYGASVGLQCTWRYGKSEEGVL